ncbi:LysM peptidoglycan-binding domain-containing protein [Thioalkalivibrio sulfidiphilus]|uniref:LysM peptidoglycan-binding domain-containing protein n=1 Tax=Thioalkalivibrio sulfidiphilus TaxID=1033854 RepID=UPI00047551DF|nr:LysM peptidoglycan-binding domain-containing protein [Thioalkalivibrio sulfidiphilus]
MSAIHPTRTGQILFATALIVALLAGGCASTEPAPAPAPQPTPAPAPVATPAPPPPAPAPVQVREAAPERYVVQRGDTLWDIANTFLRDPWYWPEIWVVNPQIPNPHLIYPGDVITLYYIDGQPRLIVDGGPRVRPTQRLSPQIRVEELPPSLDVPIQSLHQFLVRPRVVTEEQLDQAAYVLASQDDRMIFGTNDRLYVRGLDADALEGSRYSMFRKGGALNDPVTGELLGFEAIPVGDAEVVRAGDPATVVISRSDREALIGDRLMPLDNSDQDFVFTPHAPPMDTDGKVISLFDAISQIARFQVAVINLGERNGIEQGHVLATYQSGRVIRDTIASERGEEVTLPDERIGLMMVFRTFDKVSYALVMESTRPIQEGYSVRHP